VRFSAALWLILALAAALLSIWFRISAALFHVRFPMINLGFA
jgi:hypothetical protein